MKLTSLLSISALTLALAFTSCKKNQPSNIVAGNYTGHYDGIYEGNDTLINEGYSVIVTALDKSSVSVYGTLFGTYDVIVTKNGINVEPVSPTDGLSNFLYIGDKKELSFTYEKDGNSGEYIGTKP